MKLLINCSQLTEWPQRSVLFKLYNLLTFRFQSTYWRNSSTFWTFSSKRQTSKLGRIHRGLRQPKCFSSMKNFFHTITKKLSFYLEQVKWILSSKKVWISKLPNFTTHFSISTCKLSKIWNKNHKSNL